MKKKTLFSFALLLALLIPHCVYADELPFTETKRYADIIEVLESNFSSLEHSYVFNEENKELCIYIAMGAGAQRALWVKQRDPRMRENWNSLMESCANISKKLGTVLELSLGNDGTCTITYVEELNDENNYDAQNTLCVISNGEILYDIFQEYADNSPGDNKNDSTDEANSSATLGERNALQAAKEYLNVSAFSYRRMIEQLEYEGYTYSEATYGADHCGADWYEQAAKAAKEYLEIFSFSRSRLIEQLEFEGFSHDQAVYGVEQNGY